MTRSRSFVLVLVLVVVTGVVGGAVLTLRHHGEEPAATPATAPPTPQATAPLPDVRWVELAGVALPVSGTDGPWDLRDGLARGFSETQFGAALAAVHLVVRTSPSVGSVIARPTLETQVVGPNQPSLMNSVMEHATDEEDRPATARVVGYVPTYVSAGAASVDLVISSDELALRRQYLDVRVSLQWSDGDWRLVAPPQGDWATVTTGIDALPAHLRRYGGGR
jgi:hypothetical protein